jgi:tRNA modification GTPase
VLSQRDTIAAIATGDAPAALGIIRVSGAESAAVLKRVVPGCQKRLVERRMTAGVARDPKTGAHLDDVLCFYCRGPATSTGEDTAEIQGHGGSVVMRQLLDAVLSAGARLAEPGEFTYRAFRNRRIDLTQAEAVMGLIGARSARAAQVALGQLSGGLGRDLEGKLDRLNLLAAHLEAGLDFPDEDLPLDVASDLAAKVESLSLECRELLSSYTLGVRLAEGAFVAIVGPPNAGKSSVFNRLVGDDRAIVDAEPGTTRDVVEARGEVAGVSVLFHDTAGLRESDSRVERVGIEKSREAAERADLVILVLDGAAGLSGELSRAMPRMPAHASGILLALNKKDLPGWRGEVPPVAAEVGDVIPVSALTGEGLGALKEALGRLLEGGVAGDEAILTTARQHRAVTDVVRHTEKAGQLLRKGVEPELAAMELRWAREGISALLGRSATEDLLCALFSEFCIGK